MTKAILLASTVLLAAGATAARADTEINFGALSPGGCVASTNGSDRGTICGPTVAVTSLGDVFDIQAFSDHFLTVADVTFNPGAGSSLSPTNVPGETGFGENALGATSCTDLLTCEIAGNASVAISSTVGLIDAIVGSAQSGENFTVWAGNTLATLAPVGTGAGGSCTSTGTADECLVTFGAAKIVGLTSNGTGDVLLAGISVPTAGIPEPTSLAVFGLGLLGLVAARRKQTR